jgi:hypothetical protein
MTENMEADPFNISLRKFLKQVGVTSQHAIERTVENGALRGQGRLTVRAVITADGTDLQHVVEGEIDLRRPATEQTSVPSIDPDGT